MNNKDKIFSIFVGVVLLLALILSFTNPDNLNIRYSSRQVQIPDLFETNNANGGDEVMRQQRSNEGGFYDVPCHNNLDCPIGWYCPHYDSYCQAVPGGECIRRNSCGFCLERQEAF